MNSKLYFIAVQIILATISCTVFAQNVQATGQGFSMRNHLSAETPNSLRLTSEVEANKIIFPKDRSSVLSSDRVNNSTGVLPTKRLNKSKAFNGGGSTGGGDICENRIRISIANDIKNWINTGGANRLDLPSGLSPEVYSSQMNEQINKAHVQCVGPKDKGYPVEVNHVPKICRFDLIDCHHLDQDKVPAFLFDVAVNSCRASRADEVSFVTCDEEKFRNLGAQDQYLLTHHEFAGLAQIEQPDADKSEYQISNQIPAYYDAATKKLGLKIYPNADTSHCEKALWNLTDLTKAYTTAVLLCKQNGKETQSYASGKEIAQRSETFYPKLRDHCVQVCAAEPTSLALCQVQISGACP